MKGRCWSWVQILLFSVQINMKIEILNSIKKDKMLLHKVSPMYNDSQYQEGVCYNFSLAMILTSGQSRWVVILVKS